MLEIRIGPNDCGVPILLSSARLPTARHHAPQQPLMPQMVETQILAVAVAGEQREVAGCAGCQEAPFQCRQERFGEADLDEAGAGKRIAVTDQDDCLIGCHDLAAHGILVARRRAHFVFFRNDPAQSRFVSDAELKHIRGGVEAQRDRTLGHVRHGFTDWRLLLTNRTLLANYWAFFVFGYFLFFFMTWLPNYLAQTYNLNVREVGLFTILPWACAAVLLVALGYLSDYLLAHTGRLRISRSMLIGLTQLLAALAVIPIGFTNSLTVAIACITVAVAFSMGANASYYAVNVDIVPSRAATALGIMDTGFAISGFLAPAITGWVVGTFGSFQYAFLLMGGLALSSVLVVLFFHRPDEDRADRPQADYPALSAAAD